MRYLPLLLVLCSAVPLHAQVRVVAGRVLDDHTKKPIPAGEVAVKGTDVRDALRPDGVFILRVADNERITIVVRAEGYVEREIEVLPHQPAVHVTLVPERIPENQLSGDDVSRVPAATIEQTMQGKVAGVSAMSNSGAPGDIQLRLRGVTTILGNSQPLWVLDGVIVSDHGPASGESALLGGPVRLPSRIADLSPLDIESIEVLRSASATAMYGSRGGNGVVLIRTKRGRPGR